ncbi:MAG: 30S ribosomal protein S7 [Thermodesulfobacteriota bacterium]
MPRTGSVQKKKVMPDGKYHDVTVERLINTIMRDGKKSVAESIIYRAFDLVGERSKDEPLKVFKKAIDNVRPLLEVRSRRVGGATYQVPMEVRPERKLALALRWMVSYSRSRSGKTMYEKLAAEILDASQKKGGAVKKREDVHRMAEANKAFAHYRW